MPSKCLFSLLSVLLLEVSPGWAREEASICGTHRDRAQEELQLHLKAERRKKAQPGRNLAQQGPLSAARDIGDIVFMEEAGGVIARRNAFDLEGRTVTFSPAGTDTSRYRFQTGPASYDSDAATRGSAIGGLGDDDWRSFDLPFSFPFFGASYRSMYVNSDGNLTFITSDSSSSERSLGRVSAGPPRIAGLFRDLDPTRSAQGVRILLEQNRVVVTWVEVPEFADSGTGPRQTFQIRLFATGVVELVYQLITTQDAVVGIAPGELRGTTSVVSFSEGSQAEYSGAIVERFTSLEEVDVVAVSQRFFETHEDAYDYLVIYNALGIRACPPSALACESTVRNNRTGYGDVIVDFGSRFGSKSQLQAIMNMGPVTQYGGPNDVIRGTRSVTGDTPLTILSHEAGHLFLAFASVRDSANPQARPMLTSQNFGHWNFSFNSEASLLEGNRICDKQAGSCPIALGGGRFVTTATVQGYAPLDQYLMGFRAPSEVPDTFLVVNSSIGQAYRYPQTGISFDGTRRDIRIDEIIAAEGRRTPDHTVSQKHYRFAFILIGAAGSEPSAEVLQQVDQYRREFEPFYRRISGERAWADTSLRRSLRFSTAPAAGVVVGGTGRATVSIERPAEGDLSVLLASAGGSASIPGSVTIPSGAMSASFAVAGQREGVDELTAEVAGGRYERAYSNIQVRAGASALRLGVISGDKQSATAGQPLPNPVVLRASDINNLPYSGVSIAVTVAGGGSVTPAAPVTDHNGEVRLTWTPGANGVQELAASLPGSSPLISVNVTTASRPATSSGAIVNAATFRAELSPGALASIFGTNLSGGSTATGALPLPGQLAGVQVTVGGRTAPLVYVSDRQVNFVVPAELSPGDADLVITNPQGSSLPVKVRIDSVSPGVFALTNGFGAVTVAGTGQATPDRPAAAGEVLEVYATGLGAVRLGGLAGLFETIAGPQVNIGSIAARVLFSGLAPGWTGGLYQVNVQVPEGTPSGTQALSLTIGGVRATDVQIRIR